MILSPDDVIAAQSTPHGSGRRGTIRLTGPGVFSLIREFFLFPDRRTSDLDRSRPAIWNVEFLLWGPDRKIPARLWFWPEGRGFTGQETVELHLPGSPPILSAALDLFCRTGKIRLAGPGEFTLRAFLSNRLDLTQAEAVLGVIDATDDQGLKTALSQLAGNLGGPLRKLQENLLETLAHLEAGFDFVEEDIEFITREELTLRIDSALQMVEDRLRQMETRTDRPSAPRILLTGIPNSGKSSLFNRLISTTGNKTSDSDGKSRLDPERAIVSEIAGTTRDYLEGTIFLENHPFTLVDTAGVEDEEIEKERESRDGEDRQETSTLNLRIQRKSRDVSKNADFTLLAIDAVRIKEKSPLSEWEIRQIRETSPKNLLLLTKSDRLSVDEKEKIRQGDGIPTTLSHFPAERRLLVSSRTGEGIETLTATLSRLLGDAPAFSEVVPATADRCRQSLRLAAESLRRGKKILADASQGGNIDEVLIAMEIRSAADQLGLVLGTVQTDDILDRIFSRFCVGK